MSNLPFKPEAMQAHGGTSTETGEQAFDDPVRAGGFGDNGAYNEPECGAQHCKKCSRPAESWVNHARPLV
jgi:hypothetical protein